MAKTPRSVRLFEKDWMEKLSHVHPITPLVVFGPLVTWLIYRSVAVLELGLGSMAVLMASGLIVWTFTEYMLHRYLFHHEFKSELGQRFHYIIHGNHHDVPDDPTRLVMPPFAAIILASLFYGIFSLMLGPVWVQPFFAAFIIGYLCYDYIHFAVHHFTPRTRIGRAIKQGHMVHHFANPEANLGVSSPLWDVVLGTLATRGSARSERREKPRAV